MADIHLIQCKNQQKTSSYRRNSVPYNEDGIMIFLGDHDTPLTGSNFGNLTAFRAIFSHIFTADAQKRPFMNFRLKIIIRFLDPDFLIGHAISAIRGRFLLIFALDKLNVRHISTSALVGLLT